MTWYEQVALWWAFAASQFGLAVAVGASLRVNRIEFDGIEGEHEAVFELERRVAAVEQDAGIGPAGSWAEQSIRAGVAVERVPTPAAPVLQRRPFSLQACARRWWDALRRYAIRVALWLLD